MNRTTLGMLALGCLLGFAPATARADLITFDNLSAHLPMPAAYGGLNWDNKAGFVVNALDLGVVPVSPPNALFSAQGFLRITPAGPGTFTFAGAAFAGVGEDLVITAVGARDGNTVYAESFTAHRNAFSFETLNFRNIDVLAFRAVPVNLPSGGTGPFAAPFLIDNFTTGAQTAPEPDSLLLFGIGMAATGFHALRQRRLNSGAG